MSPCFGNLIIAGREQQEPAFWMLSVSCYFISRLAPVEIMAAFFIEEPAKVGDSDP